MTSTMVWLIALLLALLIAGVVLFQFRARGIQLNATQKTLEDAEQKFREFSAYRARVAKIAAELQQADSFESLAKTFFSRTVEMIGAHYGTLYVWDEDTRRLVQVGSFGAQNNDVQPHGFGLGNGLVGQCAQDRHGVTILSLPDTSLRIVSGLGSVVPRQVLLQALVQKDAVVGVLEFATLNAFADKAQYLLEELMPTLAMSIEILDRSLRTQALLDAKREQAAQLEIQQAALQDSFAKRDAANQALQAQVSELADARRAMLNIMEDLEMARATENVAAHTSVTGSTAIDDAGDAQIDDRGRQNG